MWTVADEAADGETSLIERWSYFHGKIVSSKMPQSVHAYESIVLKLKKKKKIEVK